jgi:hypothetical protein
VLSRFASGRRHCTGGRPGEDFARKRGFRSSSGSTFKPASLAAATKAFRAFVVSVSSCRHLVHVAKACRQAVSFACLGHPDDIRMPIIPETVVATAK